VIDVHVQADRDDQGDDDSDGPAEALVPAGKAQVRGLWSWPGPSGWSG